MTDRRTYVYHLEIHYPSGAFNPGFRPKLWSPEQPGDIFRWPQEKHYLDRGRAKGRANRLALWGCDVTIHRSDPVTWPDELPEREPRPSAEPRRDPGEDVFAEQVDSEFIAFEQPVRSQATVSHLVPHDPLLRVVTTRFLGRVRTILTRAHRHALGPEPLILIGEIDAILRPSDPSDIPD